MAHLYDFKDADGKDKETFGGKGAGLAEMTSLGLPVPPGFTITTEVCRLRMERGAPPPDLWDEVDAAVGRLEAAAGRTFGEGPAPLLLSVRSGAKFSMPGMMDSVLNLGVNDEVVKELIEWSGSAHFAWDAYRRFTQMYGSVVLGADEGAFQAVLRDMRSERGAADDSELTAEDLEKVTRAFQGIVEESAPGLLPTDPREQLRGAINAVLDSWGNRRAVSYRRLNAISDSLGTAVNVQMMVFGDLDDQSGTGVCFTRDPATGERVAYGDYLPRAQGEDVVAGTRTPMHLDDLGRRHPEAHARLLKIMAGLENHYKDMLDIEFTVEKDELYILQVRAGKRTAEAAVRLAVGMVREGLIDKDTALTRVDPDSLEQLHRPRIDPESAPAPLLTGVAASPGAAAGVVVFDADDAVAAAKDGTAVILMRPETTPDDIDGMAASAGILTSQGGKTSHAAVVARGMGKPAVTGAADLRVDVHDKVGHVGDADIGEGDFITIDGTSGSVYTEPVTLIPPEKLPDLDELLEWADEIRTMGVRANADLPEDAAEARKRGAQGIGLARTEHMFGGERTEIVQRIILSPDYDERTEALEKLGALQVGDFEGILEVMDGLPVVVRLLDPPLHEFLPSRLELEEQALRMVRAGRPIDDLMSMSEQVARWEEDNPMLGLRGVRLGIMFDRLYRMQAHAALEAVDRRLDAGGDPRLEIMIPLVSTVEELIRTREMIEQEIAAASEKSGREYHIPIGTMIELPRAALIAGEIAKEAEFFSFGTNDLTQMTYGLSRDDAEGLFLRDYVDRGVLKSDPFQTLDQEGVGRLIRMATIEGDATNRDLIIGMCGEHGGDPASIVFAFEVGLDYVSCSPPRLEGARLAASQAQVDRNRRRAAAAR